MKRFFILSITVLTLLVIIFIINEESNNKKTIGTKTETSNYF
ncbi:hypothetical protein BAMA111019_13010 [Bacillus manliponensis]